MTTSQILPVVSLEDALIVIGACDEAVEWVRNQHCAKGSTILNRLRRKARAHPKGKYCNWSRWMNTQVLAVLSVYSPTNLVRSALLNRVREVCWTLFSAPTRKWREKGYETRRQVARRLYFALEAHGHVWPEVRNVMGKR